MILSFISPGFSTGIHLHRERGFLTSLHLRRQKIILNRDSKENNCREFSCQKIFDLTGGLSSSRNKLKTQGNLLIIRTRGATSDGGFVLQPKDDHLVTFESNISKNLTTLYRFSRPYTFIGMIIAVSSLSLLPLTSLGDLSPAFFVGYLKALIPFLFAKVYIAGLNQLVDVEVDKINKPFLPLVSGELSMGQGKGIVLACGFMCLAMGMLFQSPPLFYGILTYVLLGTVYSVDLPLLRWKTKPYLAALCIVGLNAFSCQLALFCHIQKSVLGRPIVLTKSLGFTVFFFSLFATVLAMFKDIPDVEGDQAFGNQTFSVKYGKKKVFSLCMSILMSAYASAIVIGASSSFFICKIMSVIGHSALALILLLRAKSVDLDDNAAAEAFYMFIWKVRYYLPECIPIWFLEIKFLHRANNKTLVEFALGEST